MAINSRLRLNKTTVLSQYWRCNMKEVRYYNDEIRQEQVIIVKGLSLIAKFRFLIKGELRVPIHLLR